MEVPPVVASGSRVVLTCSYEHSEELPQALYSVKWYRGVDQFYEYLPGRSPAMKVFPVEDIEVDVSNLHFVDFCLHHCRGLMEELLFFSWNFFLLHEEENAHRTRVCLYSLYSHQRVKVSDAMWVTVL